MKKDFIIWVCDKCKDYNFTYNNKRTRDVCRCKSSAVRLKNKEAITTGFVTILCKKTFKNGKFTNVRKRPEIGITLVAIIADKNWIIENIDYIELGLARIFFKNKENYKEYEHIATVEYIERIIRKYRPEDIMYLQ